MQLRVSRPTLYPDLSGVEQLAFDVETYDPNLKELGPGVYRRDGKLLGVSLSDGRGFSEYYNLGHYDCSPDERARNERYLRSALSDPRSTKIGHSLQYDVDWIENGEYAMPVRGKLVSVEIAEALLDENQQEYNLDAIGKRRLGRGKERTWIDRFCEENGLKGDPRAWLWKMPHAGVREYATEDANLPIALWAKQRSLIEEQELSSLMELECELVRCLLLFRKTGVKIDVDVRDRNGLKVQCRIEEMEDSLFKRHGEFNANSTKQVATIYDREGIKYPYSVLYEDKTKNGKNGDAVTGVYADPRQLASDPGVVRFGPNIDDAFYTRWKDEVPLVKEVFDLRQCKSHLSKFIMGSHVKFVSPDGLIHAQFHNMRNEDTGALRGTRSGRLSGTMPNLQQQPSKGVDEYWGQMCREDFIPFEGCWWGKIDYSQIEYRFMAHFARGEGADALRAAYTDDPKTDYHQFIMDLTGLKRRYAKNLNFGVAFGMGAKKMASLFGWDLDYCYEILNVYHARAPYVRATVRDVESVAKRRGYIKTFLKRRSHLIDPRKAYTMYCRLIQGSAADLMKMAMLRTWQAGIFDALPPHVTVHDELGVSVPKTRAGLEAFREMKHVMETCIKIKVPIIAEEELGPNWADVDEFDWREKLKEVS